MTFRLSSENVVRYLINRGLCDPQLNTAEVRSLSSKNFNLLVKFPNQCTFLVKQERFNTLEKTHGEFRKEWRIQELLRTFPQLKSLSPLLSEAVHFDSEHSIVVMRYFEEYTDLNAFYQECNDQSPHEQESNQFPPVVAAAIGEAIATIHAATFGKTEYLNFLSNEHSNTVIQRTPKFSQPFHKINPGIFGAFCSDGIEFFRLFQRSPRLLTAIESLQERWQPTCLIHNDFRFYNVILHREWETLSPNKQQNVAVIRIIDWERFKWGDPAFDLAWMIADYLTLWINSLMIHPAVDLTTALQLAQTPLEHLQPTLIALVQGYLCRFPQITISRPEFLTHVMEYTGYYLMSRLRRAVEEQRPFDNQGICTMQVAKKLLCQPEEALVSIFGQSAQSILGQLTLRQKVLA
jgi:hypothetical protein